MGFAMTCRTTPKSGVRQGAANTPFGTCRTTPTPKGGVGWCGGAVPLAGEVRQIADRLDRLTVHHRDPERFFVERSELVHELHELAARVGGRG